MTDRRDQTGTVLLTVEEAARRLSTSPRFIRRLIAERRIEFVRVGRHVRISESALADFIDAGRVEPLTDAGIRHMMKGSRNAEPRRSPTFRQRAQT
jgi:excisionase family DNA binding protein